MHFILEPPSLPLLISNWSKMQLTRGSTSFPFRHLSIGCLCTSEFIKRQFVFKSLNGLQWPNNSLLNFFVPAILPSASGQLFLKVPRHKQNLRGNRAFTLAEEEEKVLILFHYNYDLFITHHCLLSFCIVVILHSSVESVVLHLPCFDVMCCCSQG